MLEKCHTDVEKLNSAEAAVRKDHRENTANFMIPYYNDVIIPSDDQINMMSDLQYSKSDVSITPCWSHLIYKYENESNPEIIPQLLEINEKYLENMETLNNKPIIGVISSRIPKEENNTSITEKSF